MPENDIFKKLFAVLESRKSAEPSSSYVASLYANGTEKINSKITEEASEVCEAAMETDKKHLVHEICDLIFHTLVLAEHREITLSEIEAELARRFGTSGIEEKVSRPVKKDAAHKENKENNNAS
ncbi:MAG: phosphoribosyl-ATP diphosphatase [Spirochaetaceae bacterium]|nr:MAG: phosphoribosyl-ATP diphosphatase [Spirochaetaceae bacterium]